MHTDPLKPFLRWAGSKRQTVPKIRPFFDCLRRARYIEPFVGSGSLFFSIRSPESVLGDTNAELMLTYQVVRDEPDAIYDWLHSYPLGRDSFYRLRAQNPSELSRAERAARFVFLNRYCFNGIYRTNKKGQFNVPYAPSKTGQLPSREHLTRVSEALQSTTLEHGDFEGIVRKHIQPGDFVYLDPPYAVQNRRIFRQYGPQTFGLNDLDRLDSVMREIDRIGATFVVSYAQSPESRRLVESGWNSHVLFTQRNVSGFSRHRRRSAELIITNSGARMPN